MSTLFVLALFIIIIVVLSYMSKGLMNTNAKQLNFIRQYESRVSSLITDNEALHEHIEIKQKTIDQILKHRYEANDYISRIMNFLSEAKAQLELMEDKEPKLNGARTVVLDKFPINDINEIHPGSVVELWAREGRDVKDKHIAEQNNRVSDYPKSWR